MASSKVIQVYEFGSIRLGETPGFEKKHLDALVSFNEKKEHYNQYYSLAYKGVRFKEYVGVLQVGNLTIEVLPKADKYAGEEDKQHWRNVLLQMLKECRLLRVNHVDHANLRLKSNSILEIYLELFLNEAEQLLHQGLLKKYRKTEGNQTALKGSLMFNKHLNQNIIHQERFYVRFTEYNRNNIFNQILYKTLCLIPELSNNLSGRAKRLTTDFPELSDCKITATAFERLIYDRKTERYREAMMISKMLLLNYRPDIKGGSENVIAILFDMNKLWEEFVYRRLKKEEVTNNMTVHRQQSADFWKPANNNYSKKIRPDIIIKHDNKTIVVDTKWKVIQDLTPSDEDLKQMFVYNLFWKCDRSILLYPASQDDWRYGEYHHHEETTVAMRQCAVKTVNVLNANRVLDKELGKRILEEIVFELD